MSAPQKDIYLVIGGSGFLGRHIVQGLLDRADSVSVFDIVQRYHDVPFYSGDITVEDSIVDALRKSGATCIIHTASPPHGLGAATYWKVNVEGTKTVIAAAQSLGVAKLVYTSSAGVVFNGEDLIDVDERLPFPNVPMDAYNETKAKAEEMVLEANGKRGLLTVALRPSGIFGPGDRQVMHGIHQVYERNQAHFQIGDNNNLFDWTYVGNVAYAHILAADKLVPPTTQREDWESDTLTLKEEDAIHYPLPSITLTTRTYRVPTCEARPLGPYVTRPADGDKIEAAFYKPEPKPITESSRPVIRSRFDQFSDITLARSKTSPLTVAGQAFFITNGEPLYFWDFIRAVIRQLDISYEQAGRPPRKQKSRITFSRPIAMLLASAAEWWGGMVGKEPAFTKFRVQFSCVNRSFNIEKARRVLGYEPQVGLEEGMKRMLEWWNAEMANGKV